MRIDSRCNCLHLSPHGHTLQPDPLTGRPSFIQAERVSSGLRETGTSVNRQRARGISEATRPNASGEPLPPDGWSAVVARIAARYDVPLIPLDCLGIGFDDEGFLASRFLRPLPGGAEARPFFDLERRVVYKLFDLRETGTLGKKLVFEPVADGSWLAVPCDASLYDTLEKLCLLHEAGACPTEVVGLAETGDYLIVKQPFCQPFEDLETERRTAAEAIKAVVPSCFIGREVRVFWADGQAWCLGDLHQGNIMREADGTPTIIDALIGPVPDHVLRSSFALQAAVQRARHWRETGILLPDDPFAGVADEDL